MGTSRGKKMVLRKWEMKIKSRRRDLRGVKPGRWKRREENGRLKTERATAEKFASVDSDIKTKALISYFK